MSTVNISDLPHISLPTDFDIIGCVVDPEKKGVRYAVKLGDVLEAIIKKAEESGCLIQYTDKGILITKVK